MAEKKSLEEMSGERKGAPKLKLNELRLNGEKGSFMYKNVLGGLKEIDGRKKFEEEEIAENVEVVFLKIRRRLYAFRDEAKPLQTQEHNTKSDFLILYGEPQIERGTNEELRTKYPALRTQQIVYAIYKGELVRVIVRGSALGSKTKAENVLDFYKYIQSFKQAAGADAHFYQYKTILSPVKEKGKANKTYFTMTFKIGAKLTEEEMKEVEEKMTIAYNYCLESDTYFQSRKGASTIEKEEEVIDAGEVDVEEAEEAEDEIDPKDIPF